MVMSTSNVFGAEFAEESVLTRLLLSVKKGALRRSGSI